MQLLPMPSRRNVVIDIETVATTPAEPNAAHSALTGRIVCIGLLLDDGETVVERVLIDRDEGQMLRSFWRNVQPTDVFVGHNVLHFDLPFIRQRSWMLGIQPSLKFNLCHFNAADVIDTASCWSTSESTGKPTLAILANALGCGTVRDEEGQVSRWWESGELASIARHTLIKVRLACLIFLHMAYLQVPGRLVGRLSIPRAG